LRSPIPLSGLVFRHVLVVPGKLHCSNLEPTQYVQSISQPTILKQLFNQRRTNGQRFHQQSHDTVLMVLIKVVHIDGEISIHGSCSTIETATSSKSCGREPMSSSRAFRAAWWQVYAWSWFLPVRREIKSFQQELQQLWGLG
jgi:hypothetical protein